MRLKLTPLIVGCAFLLVSCKKDKKPPVIQVSVVTQAQTISANTDIVLLSSDNTKQTGTSDANGNVSFSVTEGKTYYLYSSDPSNEINNANAAYMVTGTFTSQQQIDDSPFQGADTKIGDDIYKDINGDGTINFYDKVLKVVAPASGTTDVKLIVNYVVLI